MGTVNGNGTGAVTADGQMSEEDRDLVKRGVNRLAVAVSETAHSHGWWSDDEGNPKERNFAEMVALMYSELSEALEAWFQHPEELGYQSGNPEAGGHCRAGQS